MRKFIVLFLLLSSIICAETQPVSLELKWEYKTFPSLPMKALHDASKPFLYVSAKNGGLMIFDLSSSVPKLTKTFSVSDFHSLEVMNVFRSGEYLYLALGDFFANSGHKPGLAVVNISDPRNASISSVWEFNKEGRGSAIVLVEGNTAYLGAMTQGLIVLDVSNKQNISFVSQLIPDQNFPRKNPIPTMKPNARGMALSGNYLYLCYDAGGVRVIDVSEKSNPKEVSRYINASVPNKQQAYNNIVIDGTTAYAGIDYCGMEVLDISNPLEIKQKVWWNPWGCEKPFNLWFNSGGHVNEVELDKDNKLLFLSAGGSELKVIDVSDASNPKEAGSYSTPGGKVGVWGVTLYQKNIFLSYINAFIPFTGTWSGIKMLEWKN